MEDTYTWERAKYGDEQTLRLSMITISVYYNTMESKDGPKGYRFSVNDRKSKQLFDSPEVAKKCALRAAKKSLERDLFATRAALDAEN